MSDKLQGIVATDLQVDEQIDMRYTDFDYQAAQMSTQEDASQSAGKLDEIGSFVDGIFLGLRPAEDSKGRLFYIAVFEKYNGAIEEVFCSRKLYEFFFQTEFPVGRRLRITLVGYAKIKGKNDMKLYNYAYASDIQLKRKAVDILSPVQAKQLHNPLMSRKEGLFLQPGR